MKLHAQIIESVFPKKGETTHSIIIHFVEDKEQQNFEVFCPGFDPYYIKIRKWDIWELSIKWKSEIITDPKTEIKSYFTHLICTKATPIFQMDQSKFDKILTVHLCKIEQAIYKNLQKINSNLKPHLRKIVSQNG